MGIKICEPSDYYETNDYYYPSVHYQEDGKASLTTSLQSNIAIVTLGALEEIFKDHRRIKT